MVETINNFGDFVKALELAGFSPGGSNGEGVFTLHTYYGDGICWHTDDPETDPWAWRMRVFTECGGIAYAKVFFRKSGFITREWYPYFLACRRQGRELEDDYEAGMISNTAKRIYDIIRENPGAPAHTVRKLGNFTKEDNAAYERSLVELQMKMYITMNGSARKVSARGEYGWHSATFCITEDFFGREAFEEAEKISEQEAAERIALQIYKLNPLAEKKKIKKFIYGS